MHLHIIKTILSALLCLVGDLRVVDSSTNNVNICNSEAVGFTQRKGHLRLQPTSNVAGVLVLIISCLGHYRLIRS